MFSVGEKNHIRFLILALLTPRPALKAVCSSAMFLSSSLFSLIHSSLGWKMMRRVRNVTETTDQKYIFEDKSFRVKKYFPTAGNLSKKIT